MTRRHIALTALAAAALAGCGDKKEAGTGAATGTGGATAAPAPARDAATAATAPDAAPAGPSAGALAGKVPRAPRAFAVALARPTGAVVVIDPDGFRIKPAPATWGELAGLDRLGGPAERSHFSARAGVLEALAQGTGPAADQARAFREAFGELGFGTGGFGSAGTGGGYGNAPVEVEVSLTYLVATDATLPAITPTIIATPTTHVGAVLRALDAMGGTLVVDADGALAAMALAAPWTDPGWGGAPVPDDELTYDAWIVPGGLVIDAHDDFAMRRLGFVDGVVDPEIVKSSLDNFRAQLPAGAEPVVDVLAAEDASTQDLVHALAALHAAGARRVGVGVAPWAMPAFGMDGKRDFGPIGLGKRSTVPVMRYGKIEAVGELDKAIIRRFLRRAHDSLMGCYKDQLVTKPAIGGDVRVQFTVDTEGRITTVEPSGFDPEVTRCVARVIKAIELPKPDKGIVNVSTTLTFRPTGA